MKTNTIGAGAATDAGTIVGGETISPADMAEAERIKGLSPYTVRLSTSLVALILRNATKPA